MSELLTAFSLGSAAILTNACMLPLYPGLIAFLAGTANDTRSRRATGWLGAVVLAGILTTMLIVGLILYLIQQSFGALLPYLLPMVYGIVIVLGVLTLLGRSPFARLATAQAPMLRNPYAMAYVYGLLFGPMTLPCTGPVITSAFLLGANDVRALADGLLWFLAFGIGFGLPSSCAAAADTAITATVGRRASTLSPTAQSRGGHSADRHRDFWHPDRTAATVHQHCDDASGMVHVLVDCHGAHRCGGRRQLPRRTIQSYGKRQVIRI